MHAAATTTTLLLRLWLLSPDVGLGQTNTAQQDTTSEEVAVVEEAFFTPRDTSANLDSPAIWHSEDGQHWLLTTAKSADQLYVFDAGTGALLRACRDGRE